MRSLTRVSVLMGPPWVQWPDSPTLAGGPHRGPTLSPGSLYFSSRPSLGPSGIQRSNYTATSKKALRKQGPVPTGHGRSRLRPTQNRHRTRCP
jgi:hypothetical protein